MKTMLAIILLSLSSLSFAGEPFYLQQDKQEHALLMTWGTNYLVSTGKFTPKEAFITGMIIGALKEIADGNKNTGREHAMDLLADGIGCSTVFVFHYEW